MEYKFFNEQYKIYIKTKKQAEKAAADYETADKKLQEILAIFEKIGEKRDQLSNFKSELNTYKLIKKDVDFCCTLANLINVSDIKDRIKQSMIEIPEYSTNSNEIDLDYINSFLKEKINQLSPIIQSLELELTELEVIKDQFMAEQPSQYQKNKFSNNSI